MPKDKKKLQRKAARLWKEIIRLRDGDTCAVQQQFPQINTTHTDTYQADHCFTRGFKRLFLEIANGTMICSGCNLSKNYNYAINLAVHDIVKKREGPVYDRMRAEKEQGGAFLEWGRIGWLESKIHVLEQIKEMYEEEIL